MVYHHFDILQSHAITNFATFSPFKQLFSGQIPTGVAHCGLRFACAMGQGGAVGGEVDIAASLSFVIFSRDS